MAMIAAALVPLLALVGGGVDMGRSYLSQTRLQQACDAGVLAARKKLGSTAALEGEVPDDVATTGNRFFNLNFQVGSYGTANRAFEMTLETDNSISGAASVDVPTTIMRLFGHANVAVQATCEATLNFSNTDVMMVLDTTGSMNETNPSDTEPRIDVLRKTVKDFHATIAGSANPGIRIRFGFVPYATNVNVGSLLKSDWLVDSWTYQSRRPKFTSVETYSFYYTSDEVTGGTSTPIPNFSSPTCPADTVVSVDGSWVEVSSSPHVFYYMWTRTGNDYWCTGNDGAWIVGGVTYDEYEIKKTHTWAYDQAVQLFNYEYLPITHDVTKFQGASGDDAPHADWINSNTIKPGYDGNPIITDVWYTGCIEERSTYEIDDYANVDLTRALDLDLDRIPDAADPETQWRPALMNLIFERSISGDASSSVFTMDPVTTYEEFLNPGWAGFAACPSESRKLAEMTAGDVASYVDNLVVAGETYHDIGMIWGGRLTSPTGIFADENEDVDGKPTSRHLIFLTDGQTAALDINYASYGVEPLDRRRWNPESPVNGLTLTQVVEGRFTVACEEVKKRNITVWVIGFGTEMTDMLKQCAGPGRWFQADDAEELSAVFESISKAMGDLRISK